MVEGGKQASLIATDSINKMLLKMNFVYRNVTA